MRLNWLDIILILLGLFIGFQILRKILGGSWETESIIIALLIFNLSLTWRLNMKFKGHVSWHKVVDREKQSL